MYLAMALMKHERGIGTAKTISNVKMGVGYGIPWKTDGYSSGQEMSSSYGI